MKFFKCKARRDTSRSIKNWNDFHDHDPVLNTRQSSSKHKKRKKKKKTASKTWILPERGALPLKKRSLLTTKIEADDIRRWVTVSRKNREKRKTKTSKIQVHFKSLSLSLLNMKENIRSERINNNRIERRNGISIAILIEKGERASESESERDR